jgi:hypothetical protein
MRLAATREAFWFALGTSSNEISPCLRQPSYRSHVLGRYTNMGWYVSRYGMYVSAFARSFQPSNCTPVENGSIFHVAASPFRSSRCLRQLLRT